MTPSFPEQGKHPSRVRLPLGRLSPSRARSFVRAVLAERARVTASEGAVAEELTDDAELLVSELVTNAFLHAGTDVEVRCLPETTPSPGRDTLTGVLVEVLDRQPAGAVPGQPVTGRHSRGFGLQIVGALAEAWGVTYRRDGKAVWFRLVASDDVPSPPIGPSDAVRRELAAVRRTRTTAPPGPRGTQWSADQGRAFLAEASELLSGQLDEDLVAALAGQLLVPRLADWCAVWLSTEGGGMRLSRVWHADERLMPTLRLALEPDPPTPSLRTPGISWPWPDGVTDAGTRGSALAFALVAGGACQGALVIGRTGRPGIGAPLARTVEDLARRVAQAVSTARHYTRQTSISRAIQRRQLPPIMADIPGIERDVVYEAHSRGQTVGGDFYDVFAMGGGRWCFLLGDVQGKDPEAMAVTGLTRHLVRMLAREGHGVESVLGRLNAAMVEEGAEVVAAGGKGVQPRFLSLVYGELEPDPHLGGARCTLASGGHPLPLWLTARGRVRPVTGPQMLLGVEEDAEFTADTFHLAPGDTLLCVTDGVTERRDGARLLDDGDGLSQILRGCVGMGARAVAERVRQATHDFGPEPVEDDLAVLVLHAMSR